MKKESELSKLMIYAGRHKVLLYLSWGLSVVSALLALVPFWYIWRIIHDILEVAPDFGRAQQVPHYGWMAVGFAALSVLIYIAGLMCSHMGAFRVATNIRKALLAQIVKLPLGTTEKYGSGKLRRIVNTSSAATETYLAHRLPDKAGAIATPIGLLVLLLAFDWRLGILSLIPVALGFLIMMKMTGSDMEEKMREYQDALADMSNEAVEYVRGVPVVKTFGQTVFSFKRFKASIDNYERWVISYTKALRLPMMFYTTAINAVFAFLIAGGIVLTGNGVTNELLLNLIFYIVVTPVIGTTLTKIMFMSEDGMIVADAMARINEVLGEAPLSESERPQLPRAHSIELQHVSYSYEAEKEQPGDEGNHGDRIPQRPDGEEAGTGQGGRLEPAGMQCNGNTDGNASRKLALKDVCLSIPEGQTVALVGESGSGKSTLASIVTRFFDPQQGRILIGGVDIREISKKELMEEISFVFQDSHLIKASILENVRMARPKASREEVLHALELAQCRDIIEKLPKGVDTVVGTKGVYLSGGEQQRVAIARAVLKDAPILIMDEATAFADPDNEVRVQQALSVLAKGAEDLTGAPPRKKTVLMIAHRLSSVTGADCIYVMQEGRLVEHGTHVALLEMNGTYARMWKNYCESASWKIENERKEALA